MPCWWTYLISASIEALIQYVHQQGMLKKSYAVSDFFVDPEAA